MILCYFVTADPPTIGHQGVVAYGLAQIPGVTELRVIPPRQHVWGKTSVAFDHRFRMLQLAMEDIDQRIQISSVENDDTLSGYTVDTLNHLITENPNEQLGILLGSDAIDTFHLWKQWEHIVSMAMIYVCPRGTNLQETHQKSLPATVQQYVGSRILFLPDADGTRYPLTTSSTDAREDLLHRGMSDRVPERVMNYIRSHGLYSV